MTNEELKKKIIEILEETEYEWTEEKNGYILQIFYDKLADALIEAGIGDVSELKKHRVIVEQSPVHTDDNCYILPNPSPIIKQLYSGEEVEQISKERDEYKRRAEVAERALQIADALGELCGEKEYYTKRAERELQEKKKDE